MPTQISIIIDQDVQNALIDYIATTPSNFNANLFKEFLTNPYAQWALVSNYLNKTKPAIPSDSSGVPELSDDDLDPESHIVK